MLARHAFYARLLVDAQHLAFSFIEHLIGPKNLRDENYHLLMMASLDRNDGWGTFMLEKSTALKQQKHALKVLLFSMTKMFIE